MKVFSKFAHAAILGSALALLAACGGGGSGDSSPASLSSKGGLPGTGGAAAEDPDAFCKRLTKDEVAEAIGPNDGGKHDYTFGGCVWTAASPKNGFTESIFAAMLPKDQYQSVAEIGEPVSGFVDGATFSATHGELWFPCHGGDYCGIKVRTASSDNRQETAIRLGKILQGRV